MDLREFLGYFDFDYNIVSAGDKREDRIRRELVEDGKLSEEDLYNDLICLVDLQGAYLGDIGNERYPITAESVEKIVDRMEIYVEEFRVEFRQALDARGIEPALLSLEEMIEKCRELGVDSGEVCYPLAEAVANPETIIIHEVCKEIEKSSRNLMETLALAQEKSVRFVTESVVGVGDFVEDDEVRRALNDSFVLRNKTLDVCYGIPGYQKLAREDAIALYDLVKKAVEMSLKPNRDLGV